MVSRKRSAQLIVAQPPAEKSNKSIVLVGMFCGMFSPLASAILVEVIADSGLDAVADAGYVITNFDSVNTAIAYTYGSLAGTNGGNALATAGAYVDVHESDAKADARGGNAGAGGDGGNAIARAAGVNASGELELDVNANFYWPTTGGRGGLGLGLSNGGQGGYAIGEAMARTLGDGNTASVRTDVYGGKGGDSNGGLPGLGGDAQTTIEAIAEGNSWASVYDRTQGGHGGDVIAGENEGGDGGDAHSNVFASAGGVTPSVITTRVEGGAGGQASGSGHSGGTGGLPSVSAEAISLGGGLTTVHASLEGGTGGAGANGASSAAGRNISVTDAIRGGTNGLVVLRQYALGGVGGSNDSIGAGNGGSATSILTESNSMDGDTDAISIGTGGQGGHATGGSGDGGFGGNGTAHINISDTGNITALARAGGGEGGSVFSGGTGSGGDGGLGFLGEVFAESTDGGTVHVQGHVGGGNGGISYSPSNSSGDGQSASVIDKVDGRTSGDLILEQFARGGVGGFGYSEGSGGPGISGDALSQLTRSKSEGNLTIISESEGGRGAHNSADFLASGDGGSASSFGSATNTAGDATTIALANGGGGGPALGLRSDGGAAGNADAHAIAETFGNSRNVVARAEANGGDAERGSDGGDGGAGGNAISNAEAIANGNSDVEVQSTANGGRGGWTSNSTIFENSQGGAGGSATAMAVGRNFGNATVTVTSDAIGGVSGATTTPEVDARDGGGGTASAAGYSQSGNVDVSASLRAGSGGQSWSGISGNGGDATLIDTVMGDTSGVLTLQQNAYAGSGGDTNRGTPGQGGNAMSDLTAVKINSGDMYGETTAHGGWGGGSNSSTEPSVFRSNGGHASAITSIEGDDNVTSVANSIGGGSGAESWWPTESLEADGGDGYSDSHAVSRVGSAMATAIARGGSGVSSNGDAYSTASANGKDSATATAMAYSEEKSTSTATAQSATGDANASSSVEVGYQTIGNVRNRATANLGANTRTFSSTGLNQMPNAPAGNSNASSVTNVGDHLDSSGSLWSPQHIALDRLADKDNFELLGVSAFNLNTSAEILGTDLHLLASTTYDISPWQFFETPDRLFHLGITETTASGDWLDDLTFSIFVADVLQLERTFINVDDFLNSFSNQVLSINVHDALDPAQYWLPTEIEIRLSSEQPIANADLSVEFVAATSIAPQQVPIPGALLLIFALVLAGKSATVNVRSRD